MAAAVMDPEMEQFIQEQKRQTQMARESERVGLGLNIGDNKIHEQRQQLRKERQNEYQEHMQKKQMLEQQQKRRPAEARPGQAAPLVDGYDYEQVQQQLREERKREYQYHLGAFPEVPSLPSNKEIDYNQRRHELAEERRRDYMDFLEQKNVEERYLTYSKRSPTPNEGLQIGEFEENRKKMEGSMKQEYREGLQKQQQEQLEQRAKEEALEHAAVYDPNLAPNRPLVANRSPPQRGYEDLKPITPVQAPDPEAVKEEERRRMEANRKRQYREDLEKQQIQHLIIRAQQEGGIKVLDRKPPPGPGPGPGNPYQRYGPGNQQRRDPSPPRDQFRRDASPPRDQYRRDASPTGDYQYRGNQLERPPPGNQYRRDPQDLGDQGRNYPPPSPDRGQFRRDPQDDRMRPQQGPGDRQEAYDRNGLDDPRSRPQEDRQTQPQPRRPGSDVPSVITNGGFGSGYETHEQLKKQLDDQRKKDYQEHLARRQRVERDKVNQKERQQARSQPASLVKDEHYDAEEYSKLQKRLQNDRQKDYQDFLARKQANEPIRRRSPPKENVERPLFSNMGGYESERQRLKDQRHEDYNRFLDAKSQPGTRGKEYYDQNGVRTPSYGRRAVSEDSRYQPSTGPGRNYQNNNQNSYEDILDRKRQQESQYRRFDDPEYSRAYRSPPITQDRYEQRRY